MVRASWWGEGLFKTSSLKEANQTNIGACLVVEFLKKGLADMVQHSTYPSTRQCNVHRHFWEIKVGDVNHEHSFDCKTIPRLRSKRFILSISNVNKILLHMRKCLCGQVSPQVLVWTLPMWTHKSLLRCYHMHQLIWNVTKKSLSMRNGV